MSVSELQDRFEQIIPEDWGPVEPIRTVGETHTDFPDRQGNDIGWVYVSLEGNEYPYSEGLFILVVRDDDVLKVRNVVFGRP